MTLLPLEHLVVIVLVAAGLSAVVTGSKAGFPLRFAFCRLTWAIHPRLKALWGLVQCPYCNAWWGGAVVAALVYGRSWWVPQAAFAACGVMKITQVVLGGDGIAMFEKFEEVFVDQEDQDGEDE